MTIVMDIQLAEDLPESIEEPPPSSLMQGWAEAAWQGPTENQVELSLRIVDVDESQQLNHSYRGKNKPTNVLSFPMMEADVPDFLVQDLPCVPLGDIAICAEIVEAEAQQQNKDRVSHWAHMLVHGMLHLQGYDHEEDGEAEQMEQLETVILHKLGFANPYPDQS